MKAFHLRSLCVLSFALMAGLALGQDPVAGTPPAGGAATSKSFEGVWKAFQTMTLIHWVILALIVGFLGWVIGYGIFLASLDRQGPTRAGRFGLGLGIVCALILNFIVPFFFPAPLPVMILPPSASSGQPEASSTGNGGNGSTTSGEF